MSSHILRKIISYFSYTLLALSNFIALPAAFAQTTGTTTNPPVTGATTAWTMLQSIATQIPYLMQMVTAIAYVMGMYMIIQGVIKLKHFGESRTQMSQEHGLAGPLFLLTTGVLLLYVPTGVSVGMSTFWTEPNPYGYTELQGQWGEFINVIYLVVQFIGTVAFLRGLVILSHMGERGHQQGTWGKGIAHIIGGIFCINIYQTVQVIFATLGISVDLPS